MMSYRVWFRRLLLNTNLIVNMHSVVWGGTILGPPLHTWKDIVTISVSCIQKKRGVVKSKERSKSSYPEIHHYVHVTYIKYYAYIWRKKMFKKIIYIFQKGYECNGNVYDKAPFNSKLVLSTFRIKLHFCILKSLNWEIRS